MIDNVLIPTDGSEKARPGIEYGLDLAEAFDAHVHALYVIETEATYILTVALDDDEMDEYREYGEEVVSDVVEQASARGLDGTGSVRTGKVSEDIVEYAEDNGVDHIVMSGQGRGAIEKYLGSTAEKVLRLSSTPVTVVGQGER